MPRKKLKVKDTGAGDPTFALVIQFENTDGDTDTSIILESIEATMQSMNREEHIALDLGQTAFPVGENDNILILSSFYYGADDPVFEGDIIPAPTTIVFAPPNILEIEDDTENPSLNGEVDDENGTITYEGGINVIRARTTALPTENLQSLTVSMQAVANDPKNQGTYVFLEGTEYYFMASTIFVSTNSMAIWDIKYYADGDFYTIQNKGNGKFLGFTNNSSPSPCWYFSTTSPETMGIQWRITQNETYTYVFQSLYAVKEGVASYLIASTTTTDGGINMSSESTPWYLHPIDEILGNV